MINDDYLTTAIDAARLAGEFIQLKAQNRRSLNVEQKSVNDFVSEVDRGAEKIIRDHILNAFPEHGFLGEEFGLTSTVVVAEQEVNDDDTSDFCWIVDPLDGTTNFLRGIPHYAVSIALQIDGVLMVGVVYDPVKNELFTAVRDQGASLNGEPLGPCSNDAKLYGALLATGVPFSGQRLQEVDRFSRAMVNLLQKQTSGIRRLGSAALDLVYVAAGRYDGFWEAGLQAWDIAAGTLVAQEAGAIVSDFEGQANFLKSGDVIAAAPNVFADMQFIVERAYEGRD